MADQIETALRVTHAVDRLKGMFLEVPGTQLSAEDAARLSGLEPTTCQAVLAALKDARFLTQTRDGIFTRASD